VTFKKLLIIMTVTVTLVIVMLLGTSYAWYQFDNAVTSFNDVQTFEDNIDLAVVFANDDNINTVVGIPISTSEVEENSSKSYFTMTPSSAVLAQRNVAFQVSLVNIEIDSELTNTDSLKYSLLETVNGVTSTVSSGDFEDFNGDTLVLKPMTVIKTLDTTYSYEFRLWLQDNGCTLEQISTGECENQNELMDKKITGKIKVSTGIK